MMKENPVDDAAAGGTGGKKATQPTLLLRVKVPTVDSNNGRRDPGLKRRPETDAGNTASNASRKRKRGVQRKSRDSSSGSSSSNGCAKRNDVTKNVENNGQLENDDERDNSEGEECSEWKKTECTPYDFLNLSRERRITFGTNQIYCSTVNYSNRKKIKKKSQSFSSQVLGEHENAYPDDDMGPPKAKANDLYLGHASAKSYQVDTPETYLFNEVDFGFERKLFSPGKLLNAPLRHQRVWDTWTPYEMALFEAGVCAYGKIFHNVKKLLPNKTINEIVDMFYAWKASSHYHMWKRQKRKTFKPAGEENRSIMREKLESFSRSTKS